MEDLLGEIMARNVCTAIFSIGSLWIFAGCGNDVPSFAAPEDENVFFQSSDNFAAKMDILWVIDNSGSMQTSQTNVADNFNSFIQDFAGKGYDFRLAVAGTDAYRVNFGANASLARFRDGGATKSGIFVIDPLTPQLTQTFMNNVNLGTSGSGDERAFDSFVATLTSPLNAGFLRSNSFLSIIIVSDEDDFSHTSSSLNESYSNPNLKPISSYVSYLDTLTGSSPTDRRYSVNAMAIWDSACRQSLNTSFTGRKIGQRYGELVDAVGGGKKGSLCGNFANDLRLIANSIITQSTQFYLNRLPIESSIRVYVNDALVPRIEQDTEDGWMYDPIANSVKFYNSAVPPQGSKIRVVFDPRFLTQ
jgi:hypothetical protein